MKLKTKFTSIGLAFAGAAVSITSCLSSHAQGAVATISGVAVSGGYDYTILLQNTGTASLNSFWYGWTIGVFNLPSIPSGATNLLGWGNSVAGHSIEWVNSTGTALAPGQTGTFMFFSTDAPAAITASPAGQSVAYLHGIDFTENTPGSSTPVFSPTLVAAPEPSAIALLGLGSLGMLATGWRKRRDKKQCAGSVR